MKYHNNSASYINNDEYNYAKSQKSVNTYDSNEMDDFSERKLNKSKNDGDYNDEEEDDDDDHECCLKNCNCGVTEDDYYDYEENDDDNNNNDYEDHDYNDYNYTENFENEYDDVEYEKKDTVSLIETRNMKELTNKIVLKGLQGVLDSTERFGQESLVNETSIDPLNLINARISTELDFSHRFEEEEGYIRLTEDDVDLFKVTATAIEVNSTQTIKPSLEGSVTCTSF